MDSVIQTAKESGLLPHVFIIRGAKYFETFTLVKRLKSFVFYYVVFTILKNCAYVIRQQGFIGGVRYFKKHFLANLISKAKSVPLVKGAVKKEVQKNLLKLQHQLVPPDSLTSRFRELPYTGLDDRAITLEVKKYSDKGNDRRTGKPSYLSGKVSGAIYYDHPSIRSVVLNAMSMFLLSNPLHPDLFPGLRQMEAEIVQMVLSLFNGKNVVPTIGNLEMEQDEVDEFCGTTTSGGTESILMAMKAYREWGRIAKGITEPEIIAPVSIHAAFDKAAHYFGIKLIHIPIDPVTFKVRVDLLQKNISRNTIVIAVSAPGFPHGIVDDIDQIATIALKHKIGLHVDCCLGGFLLPFIKDAFVAGSSSSEFVIPKIPVFDFRQSAVTSISCDTHKYGFAPKGTSVIMYRSKALRRYQYFVAEDWPGGVYASPTISGSRPGSLIAGCWAALIKVGYSGYVASTREIIQTAQLITRGVREIEGLDVFGEPMLSVVAFGSKKYNIFTIGEEMSKLGWNLNMLQNPPGIHLCCTMQTVGHANDFLIDLKNTVVTVSKMADSAPKDMGAIYGMAASLPDRSIVRDLAIGFVDTLYKT